MPPRTVLVVGLAVAVFALGALTGTAGLFACSEYNSTSHSLRARICPTVGTDESWVTLALLPPILVVIIGLVLGTSRAVTTTALLILFVEAAVLALIVAAAS